MSQQTFLIKIDCHEYYMFLPSWKSDYIQGMLAAKSVPYELVMLRAMATMLSKGDLVLDVGANIGNHSLYLAVATGCRVVAFEPNPILASPLQKSISVNRLENSVTLIQKAVGASHAKATFSDFKPDNLGAQSITLIDDSNQIEVDASVMEVISLDSMTFDSSVKVIKIDVEGMELAVLKGAKSLIEKDRPTFFIESHNEEQFSLIHDFLAQWGYVYWRTFNATPTNLFLPPTDALQVDLQQHGLEQGKDFYKLWEERWVLKKRFLKLQKKYDLVNTHLVDIQAKLDVANLEKSEKIKISERSALAPVHYDDMVALSLEFLTHAERNDSEQILGLDFSLPEER